MNARLAGRLAGGVWGAAFAFVLAAFVVGHAAFLRSESFDWGPSIIIVGLAFVSVGAFLASRRPQNPIGWLFLAWGFVMCASGFAYGYGLPVQSSLRPGASWVVWAESVLWHSSFIFLVHILLLFPYGRFTSSRWRICSRIAMVVYPVLAVATGLSADAAEIYYPDVPPPFALSTAPALNALFGVLLMGQLLIVAAAMVSLVLKLRGAQGRERQQVKWFVYSVAGAVTAFIAGVIVLGAGYLFPAFGLIPVVAGIAILRYNLYDIDRVINRTLTYGLLTAGLAATYFALVVGLQELLRPVAGSDDYAIVTTTLIVAALFLPARRRIQDAVDRRFNRRAYDAARTVDGFSARLREQVDLDTLHQELLGIVNETMQPREASLWLRARSE